MFTKMGYLLYLETKLFAEHLCIPNAAFVKIKISDPTLRKLLDISTISKFVKFSF